MWHELFTCFRMELQMEVPRMGGTGGWRVILGWSGFIFCSVFCFGEAKMYCFSFFFWNILKSYHQKKRGTTTKSLESIYIKKPFNFSNMNSRVRWWTVLFAAAKWRIAGIDTKEYQGRRSHGSMPSCELMKSGSLRQCELFYWWVKRTKINVVEW